MSFLPFLLLQVGIFLGLAFLLRLLFLKHLTGATTHLQSLSAEYTRRHEELKQRLEQSDQQYREQMLRAKTESEQLVVSAKQEADVSKGRAMEEARLESERIVQQALESRDSLRKELEQALETRAIARACELLQQVLSGPLREQIQSHWLDDLLRNGLSHLEQRPMQEAIEEVRVVSAFPLTVEQRRLLQDQLKKTLDREVPLKETMDAQLIAGFVLTLGSVVFDGSLASKLQQAARDAQRPG